VPATDTPNLPRVPLGLSEIVLLCGKRILNILQRAQGVMRLTAIAQRLYLIK
jgi:hypothetical protein